MKTALIILSLAISIFIIGYGIAHIPSTPSMSNDSIIQETKKCHDAALRASVTSNFNNGDVIAVHCRPSDY